MRLTFIRRLACSFLLFVTAAVVSTTYAGTTHYRWYDDRGTPVHSDRPPPPGIDYEVVDTGSSLVRKVDADQGAVPRESEPRVGNQFKKTDTKPEAPKKNSEICERATENLATLKNYARIRVKDENGDLRYLTEEEIEAQKDEAEALIAINCE